MGDILWDVVEEHLDEAEFLAEVWHVNLDSPAYLRDEFEKGPQERLMAHVDGLVVGGDEVRTELLEAALADEDTERWRAAAAALALTGLGGCGVFYTSPGVSEGTSSMA